MKENRMNNSTIQSTPQVESVVKNVPRKMNVLLITNIFLTLLIIGLGVYIFMTDKKVKQLEKGIQKKENITQKDADENKIVEKEKTTETEYKGEYISAKLPKGWEIKEYTGGDAITTAEKSVQYSGLTNLIISKDKENIFEMKIIDGIGLLGCPEYVSLKTFLLQKFKR